MQDDERRRCLAYLEEEFKIAAFDLKAREAFENAMVQSATKLNASQINSQEFQKEISQAVSRLDVAAKETVRRRDKMTRVPNIALATYSAWHRMYLAYSAWTAVKTAQEAKSARVSIPIVSKNEIDRTIKLFQEYEKCKIEAAKGHHKLLKRLKLSDEETQELFNNALAAIEAENWQPKS
ncbi:MAG: hypothetical protein GH159_01150 [Dehalococcoidia bacterium]|nr:hypothetical protein [Dehalococcoidia bacterium]